MKYSPRIDYLIQQVPNTANVIDVAADHGYVAITLSKINNQRKIIASDIALGPLNAGKQNAQKQGIENIDFRLGDGFSVLKHDDTVDVAIIAGIGGKLMEQMLEQGIQWNIPTYILQANNDVQAIRHWLYEHGYQLLQDERIPDGNFIYECLVAQKSDTLPLTRQYPTTEMQRELSFFFGPEHIKRNNKIYKQWLIKKITLYKEKIEQMQYSKNENTIHKIDFYQRLVDYGQERLAQLEE